MSSGLPEIRTAETENEYLGRLNSNQVLLYRHAERWLSQHRHLLGENQNTRLADPTPSHLGIECKVINVSHFNRDIMEMFRAYDQRCGDVTSRYDDERGKNVYRVSIPYPPGGPEGDIFQKQFVPSWWTQIIDEPKNLIIAFAVCTLSAVITTSPSQWTNLLALAVGANP